MTRAFVTEDAEMVLRLIDRQKKRQTLDVVPMRMCQQQGQIERLAVELGGQVLPEQAQASAGVQDHDLSGSPDFNTRGIAAVADGFWPRRRNRAAHTPEGDARARSCSGCGRRGSFAGCANFFGGR